eukprot:434645-Alexandrium_andersonii.AAC.1
MYAEMRVWRKQRAMRFPRRLAFRCDCSGAAGLSDAIAPRRVREGQRSASQNWMRALAPEGCRRERPDGARPSASGDGV